jgi:hypothetical protein
MKTMHVRPMCIAIGLFVCTLLAGCPLKISVKSEPYDAMCEPSCFEGCDALDKWDGSLDHAATLLKIDALQLKACDVQRGTCAACLDRLERAGVIRK